MVFDEVDAGVGGQAAGEIGRRLARLARDHQIVVVTHLAQVAAFADTHLVVDKSPDTGAGVTATDIRSVEGEDRVRELARMLSGLTDSDTGQAHARELLSVAAAGRS
jgi:DNA repair protein RecN (Recombination protein N)